jgi:succinate-semialdehyde dehydrogenase/glutarate-semialdehyde dehydrogenase
MALKSINPYDGQELGRYNEMSTAEVAQILHGAAVAQREWAATTFAERGACFHKLAVLLRQRVDDHAPLMTREMGKPVGQSRAEIEKCAWGCEYFADHAEGLLEPSNVDVGVRKSYVAYRPIGVVFAIMPWNYPFWQVLRCCAPAMMAGNTVVLKHANNVTGCAMAIEQLFRDAGFPEDAFRTLVVDILAVENVIRHDAIAAVSLTGSTRAGQSVGRIAGESLKKCVLELGGSDPFVVLEDANLDLAVAEGVTSRIQNNGQSCIAAKRFIVVDAIREPFERAFVEKMAAIKIGDPMEDTTELGPMARQDLKDSLSGQVNRSVECGAAILTGGASPELMGAFYAPTVLGGVTKGMPAYEEELFGPAAAIISAQDTEDALRIANDTAYGLGAAIFTENVGLGETLARDQIEAGACFVNTFTKSDPRLPFGGIRASGFGRELGAHGMHEFVNVKTVFVA